MKDMLSLYAGIARKAAVDVTAAFAAHVDLEDMTQEAVVWLVEHPREVERRMDGKGGVYVAQLIADIQRHLNQIAREEYRAATGKDPLEGQPYNPATVRRLLPAAWTDEGPEKVSDGQPRARKDPREGNAWGTAVLDVRQALDEAVGTAAKRYLFRHYVQGETWPAVAAAEGVEEGTAKMAASRAVRAMVAWLNGDAREPRPGRTLSDGPGTRRVRTNHAAQSVTDAAYEGG